MTNKHLGFVVYSLLILSTLFVIVLLLGIFTLIWHLWRLKRLNDIFRNSSMDICTNSNIHIIKQLHKNTQERKNKLGKGKEMFVQIELHSLLNGHFNTKLVCTVYYFDDFSSFSYF